MVPAQKQNQWSRIEISEITPHTYSQLIFGKGDKYAQQEKQSLFSEWLCESQTATFKSTKLEHILTPCTKINLKWLKDLNIGQDSTQLLEENIHKIFSDIYCTSVFLG